MFSFLFQLDDRRNNQEKPKINSARKETNSRLTKQQSKSESEEDTKHNDNFTNDTANLEQKVSSLIQTVIAKAEPVDMSGIFNPEDKGDSVMVPENCDRVGVECDLNPADENRIIPRPESSGSSEVSVLHSDHGLNFAREDEAFNSYSSYHPNYNSTANETERCRVQFSVPENGCEAMSRLTCERSPNMTTNEPISPWYQNRIDQFSASSVAPSNYQTIDPSYPISASTSAGDNFRTNSSCDNRLEYAGYAYSSHPSASSYFSAYHHRPAAAYTSYADYTKF